MPVWLQVTAVVCPALASFLMGIALIPFLERYQSGYFKKFKNPKNPGADTGQLVRPTMCGLLLLFGTVAGFVLSFALYQQFCRPDRTGFAFQTENRAVFAILGYGLFSGLAGLLRDVPGISDKFKYFKKIKFLKFIKLYQFLAMFLVSMLFLRILPEEFRNSRNFPDVLYALLLAGFQMLMQSPERETDGISITTGMIQLLCLSMLLLAQKSELCAMLSFATAGSAIGCLFWNLHPTKCRLGHVGTFFLGAIIPALCLMTQEIKILFLYLSVYLLNALPGLFRKSGNRNFLGLLKQAGYEPVHRIAIFGSFALFCCALAIISQIKN